jgi:hypothetical protein
MRILKFILSSMVFTMTFIIVLAAEYATLALITLPGGSGVVERVHLFPDPEDSDITYADAITFWATDIQQSLVLEGESPEYNIRGWVDQTWWYENTEWADYAWTQVKAIIVPIAAPVYEIKELYVYYGTELSDFLHVGQNLTVEQRAENFAIETVLSNGLNSLGQYDRNGYQYVYNILRKIAKYNAVGINEETGETYKIYRRYVEKFINYTGNLNGVRGVDYEFESVDALSAFLFYQLFLALVLAAYFTYQNPIVVKKNGFGENEVEGNVLPRFPKLGLGKRNNKKNKEKDKE